MGRGNAIPILPHAVEMELDGLPHDVFDLFAGSAGGHATGEIRGEGGEPRFGLSTMIRYLFISAPLV